MLPRMYMFVDLSGGSPVPPERPGLTPIPALPSAPIENTTVLSTAAHSGRVLAFRRSDRISILFAAFTLVCGVYCLGYLFRSPDPEHRITPWPREFFYQRPPDLASGVLDEHLAKNGANLPGSPIDRSLSRAESVNNQPTVRTPSPVLDKPSLPPVREPNRAIGQLDRAVPGSTSGGNSIAQGGASAPASAAAKGSGNGSAMKAEKPGSRPTENKNGQTSNGSSMGASKDPNQVTSCPASNNHAATARVNSIRAALQASRSNLANQRAQRAIFSQMRTLSAGQRATSGGRASRGGGHRH